MKTNTRCLPNLTRKLDIDFLRQKLATKDDLNNEGSLLNTESVLAHWLLLFLIQHNTLVFAAPSGLTQEVKGTHVKAFMEKLLADPHISKVGLYSQKQILKIFY